MRSISLLLLCCSIARSATLSGVVRDATTNAPIPGVSIALSTSSADLPATTTIDGTYTISDVPMGTFSVTVVKPGYVEYSWRTAGEKNRVSVQRELATHDFSLTPHSTIFGRVTDRDTGDPVPSLRISPLREDYNMGARRYLQVLSGFKSANASGEFDLPGLQAAAYVLEVGGSVLKILPGLMKEGAPLIRGYGVSWFPESPRPDEAIPVSLAPGERRPIEIRVTKRDLPRLNGIVETIGESVGPVDVQVLRLGVGTVTLMAKGEPDAEGRFHVDGIGEGEYSIVVRTANKLYGQTSVQLLPGKVAAATIVVSPGATVDGIVRTEAENLKLPGGLTVQLSPVTVSSRISPAFVSTDGRFSFAGVSAGDFFARVSEVPEGMAVTEMLFGGHPVRNSAVTIGSGSFSPGLQFTLSVRLGSVAGTVRDRNGEPVANATIVMLPESMPPLLHPDAIRDATSSGNGAYAFRDVPPGRYKIFLLPPVHQRSKRDQNLLRQLAAFPDAFEVHAGQIANVPLEPK